ncbi:MAG: hypothetical protein CMM77_13905 [Rhodospirillaceae bacterium]|nr:hypothetical protein [Rhodospirillaceae bacterium]
MSRSSTFRTTQGFLVPGLCFAAVLLWLSAVAGATPWNGGTVQTSAPLSLPGSPDLSVREKREALLRRALGRVVTSAPSLESLTDLDGSLALPAMMPTLAPADSQGPIVTAANRQTWRLSPTDGFQSRAPPGA